MTKKQIFRLNKIIGGLYVGQWKGKKKQDEYRKAVNTIFHHLCLLLFFSFVLLLFFNSLNFSICISA